MFVSIAYSEKSRQENNIAVEAAPAVTSCPCNRYLTYPYVVLGSKDKLYTTHATKMSTKILANYLILMHNRTQLTNFFNVTAIYIYYNILLDKKVV